jgi:hypothetical protein
MTTILALAFATPASLQATVRQAPACRLSVEALNGAGPPAPTANALPPGCETSTLPWSAPVGHRQPQAIDVSSSASSSVSSSASSSVSSSASSSIDQAVLEENARIDEVIKGVCRGC